METIYLQDNLKAVVKLERPPDTDAEVSGVNTIRTKIGEIFQTSRDHLAFVCVHCAAEFPLFIQFASHIETHMEQIHSNTIKSAQTIFYMDRGSHHIDIKPLKHERESDDETANFEDRISDDDEDRANVSDSHPKNSNIHVHIGGENITAKTNLLNGREELANEKPLNAGDISENIGEDEEISNQIDYQSDTQTTQPVNVSSQKNISNNQNIKIFECFDCHREFKSINSRKNCIKHMRTHLKSSKKCTCCTRPMSLALPIECFLCNETFTQHKQYMEHGIKRHTLFAIDLDLMRRICKRCSNKFNTKILEENQIEFNRIVKRYNERNFSCKLCDRVFRKQSTLQNHMYSHDGSGNFECEICKQRYPVNYKSSHMRTHTGERQHQCSKCGLLLFNKSRLYRHMKIHTNERPHECDYCHKFFRTRCTLTAHRRIHTGEYIHNCESCKKGYTEINGLRKHNLKVHGIQMERKKRRNILVT